MAPGDAPGHPRPLRRSNWTEGRSGRRPRPFFSTAGGARRCKPSPPVVLGHNPLRQALTRELLPPFPLSPCSSSSSRRRVGPRPPLFRHDRAREHQALAFQRCSSHSPRTHTHPAHVLHPIPEHAPRPSSTNRGRRRNDPCSARSSVSSVQSRFSFSSSVNRVNFSFPVKNNAVPSLTPTPIRP